MCVLFCGGGDGRGSDCACVEMELVDVICAPNSTCHPLIFLPLSLPLPYPKLYPYFCTLSWHYFYNRHCMGVWVKQHPWKR